MAEWTRGKEEGMGEIPMRLTLASAIRDALERALKDKLERDKERMMG